MLGQHKEVEPAWAISRDAPIDLQAQFSNPGNRRRWWQSLFP